MPKVAIIGSGFSSFSAASTLAAKGIDVHIFEKNETVGGRSRQFSESGFKFDMGPSWYWMPEIFERFFNNFGHSASDFYELKKLDPSFKIIFQWGLKVKWLSRFYFSYLVLLLPFYIVNGMLTGMWLNEPVVIYNDLENLNIRWNTIPIEDVFYGMLLLLINIGLYEYLQSKQHETSTHISV